MENRELTRQYWNQRNTTAQKIKFWYQHPQALRFYRDLVVASDAELAVKPINAYLRQAGAGRVFKRGLSIGCGAGAKEMRLISDGLVDEFDMFDLSDEVLAQGAKSAERLGLSDRAHFKNKNVFDEPEEEHSETYDLVHWDNALHHMFDVPAAIQFSKRCLKEGGTIVIDDYVGPSYFGFDQHTFELADHVRALLPQRYLANPNENSDKHPFINRVPRIPKAAFLRTDPSEMADSGRTLDAVAEFLPNAEVIRTGGLVYFLALRPLFGNFDPASAVDRDFLATLLTLDVALTKQYPETTCHAFIVWSKPSE